jgi:multiple antibiotic resistance protein
MVFEYLLSAFVTLLVVVDPVGLAPVFLALTHGQPKDVRLQVGLRGCVIALGILFGTALIGEWVLARLAITLPAFRIAGGLLLFSIAFEMLFGRRKERDSKDAEQAVEEHMQNIAAFPLAIPLMAGPGAITATVLLAGRAQGSAAMLAGVLLVIAAVIAVCWLVFLFAARIERILGVTGNVVLSRLLGLILAALAVQFAVDGIRDVWTS